MKPSLLAPSASLLGLTPNSILLVQPPRCRYTPRMSTENHWRMPAEWEKQEAVWLGWPHNHEDWPDRFAPIPWVYVEMLRHLTQTVRVRLLVRDERARVQAKEYCKRG